jgi:hypothetical protein
MRWIILPAVLIASCVAATSDAAGLFADDQGMIIPDHRLPVYMAYRGGAAPCDYPGTAYAGCGNQGVYGNGSCNGQGCGAKGARYQPFAPGYHGYMGNGCYGRCSNVWSGYDHCARHGGGGCKSCKSCKGCKGGHHGAKGWGCGAGVSCKGNACGAGSCSRCPNKVFGLDFNCGRGCGAKRPSGHGCGCQPACQPKCGHGCGFKHAIKSKCGHGCGCKKACGANCGCASVGCRKTCKTKKFGFCCGLKGLCSDLGACFSNTGGCGHGCTSGGPHYGHNHIGGEVISGTNQAIPQGEREVLPPVQEVHPPVQQILPPEPEVAPPAELVPPQPAEADAPLPPMDARSGVNRPWQQASAALFPSLRDQQNR